MVTLTMHMNVRPSKQKELLQTIEGLTKAKKRSEHGFLDARFSRNTDSKDRLTLIEEWETTEDVAAYLQSEYFCILRGAMQVLTMSSEIELSADEHLMKSIDVESLRERVRAFL